MNYLEFLSKYSYPQELINIARGDIAVPEFTFKAPADLSFGFPPALIPLWSEGNWPGYIGIVKPWSDNQPYSYVQYFSEENSLVEIAKNLQQLKAWMTYDFLCNVPDTDEVERFAESIGFCKTDELETIFADCDDVTDLAYLDMFKYELPAVLKHGETSGYPEWHSVSSGTDEIRSHIDQGRFEQAWQQLNSGISDKTEIADILSLLSRHAEKQNEFQDLITCWKDAN